MSTISSQLIVTSSALIEDLYKVLLRKNGSDREYVFLGRMAVLLSIQSSLWSLALEPDSTILDLVAYAWAGFGGAFGPVILLSLFWRKMTTWGATCWNDYRRCHCYFMGKLNGSRRHSTFSYMKLYPASSINFILYRRCQSHSLINQTRGTIEKRI